GYVRSNMELVGDNLVRFDELLQHTDQLLQALKAPTINQEQVKQLIEQTLQCCEEIKEDEVSEDLANLIKDGLYGVDQIAELVVSLRDFSRIDESKVKDIDINECINTSLIMARNNLKTLDVKTNLAELPLIQCNPSQINQVLLNLFNNAAQAIPSDHKGTLQVTSSVDKAQQHVVVRIIDNGSGIKEDVLNHIFEPFFTTKKAGDGTGLGLAITAQIMEQHDGRIEVSSIVGEGTTFTLMLPIQSIVHEQKPSQALFES
ncbi:MAG: two-component system NtrC family sensor kinase, partial [Psychrobacter glaciei]